MRHLSLLALFASFFSLSPAFAAYDCPFSSANDLTLAQCAKDLNANLGGETLLANYQESNGANVPNVCYNTSVHVKKVSGNTVVTLTQNGNVQSYTIPGNPSGLYCFREVKGVAGFSANNIDRDDPGTKPIVIDFSSGTPKIAKAATDPKCTTAKDAKGGAKPFMSLDSGAMTGLREALIKEARAIRGDASRKNQNFSRCKTAYLAAYEAKGGTKDDLYKSMDEGDSWLFQHMNHPRATWENQTQGDAPSTSSDAAPAGF